MPFCPECGNKVSITDKRCSKCGTKVAIVDPIIEKPDGKKRHNIEFALAMITVVLSILEIPALLNQYSFAYSGSPLLLLIFIAVEILGAIITRYYAKPGSIIVLISCIGFVLLALHSMSLAIIFAVITVIVAFVLN